MRLAWMLCAACAATPASRTIENRPAPRAVGEPPLALDPKMCDLEGAETVELDARETLAVVTCHGVMHEDDDSWPLRAYLVRRSSPTTGSEQLLGEWVQTRESGGSWQIAGVVRDAARRVTRVIVEEAHGGLDQGGDLRFTVYDPTADLWTGQTIAATNAKVVIAPGDASASVVTCKETVAVIDQTVPCEDSPGRILETIPIR